MNSTELNNFLNKAGCCAGNKGKQVADLLLNGSKCADAEFKNLALLTSAIEGLRCYRAPVKTETCEIVETGTSTDAQFTITVPCVTIPVDGVITLMSSSGLEVTYTVVDVMGEGLGTAIDSGIIPSLPAGYTGGLSAGGCMGGQPETFTFTTPCYDTTLSLNYTYMDGITLINETIQGVNTIAGVCASSELVCTTTTTEYTNCLTETEANNLVNMITKICDSCNCD